jgi:hypothetical protein
MDYLKIIILAVLMAGCSAPKVLQSERIVRDSVIFRTVEKEVLVPGTSGESFKINIDSLAKMIRSGVDPKIIERTLYREDPDTKMRVGILIDSLGNLMAVCDQQERMITVMIEERELLRTEFERIVIRERENLFQRAWKFVKTGLVLFGLVILSYIVFRIIRAFRKKV